MIYEGTYRSLIQGVSQQTPQERLDGQLGAQVNMLSDPVNGLRRRTGTKLHGRMNVPKGSKFDLVQLGGEYYIQCVTPDGRLVITRFTDMMVLHDTQYPYLAHSNKSTIRSTISRNQAFILNTEKVPNKVTITTTMVNPKGAGWVRILSGAFSKQYSVSVTQGSAATLTYSVTTHVSTAAQATPEYVATSLYNIMALDTAFTSRFAVYRDGTSLAIIAKDSTDQLVIEASGGDLYLQGSGASTIRNKDTLPPTLPAQLDGYIQAVGTSNNLSYYQYNHTKRVWTECGAYEDRYTIQNTPMFWYFDYNLGGLVVETLDIQGRNAGDDNNNPEPAFLGFGITGIGAYQSRLILLSGAYVCMSKSTDPSVFMRTTVEEVLDDDPIEISATSLSNSQFEYAIPFNKDLVLFSNTQQAVVPANSTVLTPKSAVIYPSTQTEVSMAVKPIVAARSLYYVYQRGLDYYQVGEVIPNQYTDSQYNPQNLTDHLPLYATGVCTGMAGSSTNNMVVFTSDTNEVLVNQFVWQGDSRNIMGFHKWVLPRKVLDAAFLQEYNIFFVEDTDGNTLVLTTNTQLNQLGTKPVPFLDIYQYVTIDNTGVGQLQYIPEGDLVGVIYDEINSRHTEVAIEVLPDGTVQSVHQGVIAVGLRYTSLFTLTPPYLKDGEGRVLAGVKSTVQSFPLTFKGTGEFKYTVQDFLGTASEVNTSAATWSEVNLGYTWINSVNTTVIPCRAKLDSLACTIQTDKTTDLNLTTAGFVLRTARKHQKPRG